MNEQLVSYLLPVFNAERTIVEAVESVLKQTYKNIELLIIDDGCTDRSMTLIRTFNDNRIRIISNGNNKGLVASLNIGLSEANGEYIARIDADDICSPNRTQMQLDFIQKNQIDIAGSFIRKFEQATGIVRYPITNDEIKISLLFNNPMVHPSIFFHRRLVDQGLFRYEEQWKHVEDYALWIKLMDTCTFGNVQQPLINYRINAESVCGIYHPEQLLKSDLLRKNLLSKTLPSVALTEDEWKWMRNPVDPDKIKLEGIGTLISKLVTANERDRYFNSTAFKKVLLYRFLSTCLLLNRSNQKALKKLLIMSNEYNIAIPFQKKFRVFIKGLLNWK
jgi:glycosyltransferase involved in cell wall biosynthesis